MNVIDKLKFLFWDRSFLIFLIVGVVNTLFGLSVYYFSYNVLHAGYWPSSIADYVLGSVLSYFLNKRFSFHYQATDWRSISRFTINIVVCFVIAYAIARPVTQWLLEIVGLPLTTTWIENIAGLTGTGIFMVLNYLGQRFFAFQKKEEDTKDTRI